MTHDCVCSNQPSIHFIVVATINTLMIYVLLLIHFQITSINSTANNILNMVIHIKTMNSPITLKYDQMYSFDGLTEDECLYGGYQLHVRTLWRNLFLHNLTYVPILQKFGPFCHKSPSIPLVGSHSNELILSNGEHLLSVYAYSPLFKVSTI